MCPCRRYLGTWASECILGGWGGSVEPCSCTSPHRPAFLTPDRDLFQSRQPGDLGAPGESAQVLACVSGLGPASGRPRPLGPRDHGPCGHDRTCSVFFAGPCLSWSSWNSWIWEATIWKCWCGEGGAVVGGAGPGRVVSLGHHSVPVSSCSLTPWGPCPTCVSCGWTGTSCRPCPR